MSLPHPLQYGATRSRPQGTACPAQGPRLPDQGPYLKPNTLSCSSPEHDSAFQEPAQSVWVFVNLRKKKKKAGGLKVDL